MVRVETGISSIRDFAVHDFLFPRRQGELHGVEERSVIIGGLEQSKERISNGAMWLLVHTAAEVWRSNEHHHNKGLSLSSLFAHDGKPLPVDEVESLAGFREKNAGTESEAQSSLSCSR